MFDLRQFPIKLLSILIVISVIIIGKNSSPYMVIGALYNEFVMVIFQALLHLRKLVLEYDYVHNYNSQLPSNVRKREILFTWRKKLARTNNVL